MVVDHFSKGLHLGSLPQHHTVAGVARLFMEISGKLHGMPKSLVSDRDPLFISHFWKELFKLSGTKLRMSSAYHPQSDGQTEVMNRIVEQYLRAFVHHQPSTWGRFLTWAEWSYNTSVHSATGMSPYEITFGKKPPCFLQYIEGTSKIEAVDEWLIQRDRMIGSLVKKLTKAQQRMKEVADRRRREVQYAEGDQVLVRLRPHKQTSASGTTHSKLAKRFYGPFQITKRIGSVAYQLQLPPDSRIHPLFHCSLLKLYLPSNDSVPLSLPPKSIDNQPCIFPLAILDTKWDETASRKQLMVLVQWAGLFPEDTSWELWDTLKQDYNLEDKVVLEACRDDMNREATEHNAGIIKGKRRSIKPRYLEDYVAK